MDSLAPRLADFPVCTLEKLRLADTDRNGHITNSVFAACCQNARMELLCDPPRVPVPSNTQFVVARLVLHWPGIVVDIIDRIGRCSVALSQGLFVGGQCVATSASVVVLIDATRRRSTPLPLGTVEALRAIAPHDSGCSIQVAKVQRPSVSQGSATTHIPGHYQCTTAPWRQGGTALRPPRRASFPVVEPDEP